VHLVRLAFLLIREAASAQATRVILPGTGTPNPGKNLDVIR
jgi:hypothetical protein